MRKCNCYSSRKNTYEKFELAHERLNREQDILNIIRLNRVSKFLHKVSLLKRQRLIVSDFADYVVTDRDLI